VTGNITLTMTRAECVLFDVICLMLRWSCRN